MLLCYQNCTPGFTASADSQTSSSTSPAPVAPNQDVTYDNLDPQTFYGNPRCPPGTFVCESFETATYAVGDRLGILYPGPSTIDSDQAARGSKSYHFNGSTRQLTYVQNGFPRASGKYYGRIFVYLESLPTASHFSILVSRAEAYGGNSIRIGSMSSDGTYYLGVGSDGGPSGDWGVQEEGDLGPLPMKKWFCIEWMHDEKKNETRIWRDSHERLNMHISNANAASVSSTSTPFQMPQVNFMLVGVEAYWGGVHDVRLDDLTLADDRIGCQR